MGIPKIPSVDSDTNLFPNAVINALKGLFTSKGDVVINARDFGAHPSASPATNTAALASAFAATSTSNSSDVYIPAGAYKVNTITVPNNVTLRGDWAWAYQGSPSFGTSLVFTAASTTGYVVQLGQQSRLLNLAVVGSGKNSTPQHDGVRCNSLGVMENVTITGVRHGVDGNYTSANKIVRCQIHGNAGDGIRNTVDSQIYDNYVNENFGNGINLQAGANDNAVALNKVEWNDGYGVVVFSSGANVVANNIIDRNGKAGALVNSAYRFVIAANQFRRNGRLSQGVPGDDTHLHLESNISGIVGQNETHSGAGDLGEGYNSPASSVYTLANQEILITNNDFAGATGTKIVNAGDGSEKLWGNIGISGVQTIRNTRANVGAVPISIAPTKAATVTFALNPIANYSRGDGYEISIVSRNEASGNRSIDGVYCVVIREGGDAAVQFGTAAARFGSSMATVSGAVTADGGTLTLTITNTANANLSTLVSLRQL